MRHLGYGTIQFLPVDRCLYTVDRPDIGTYRAVDDENSPDSADQKKNFIF
jgi:hypothetical protein